MTLDPNTVIRLLTTAALGGLLFTVGLRLTWREMAAALRRCRVGWLLFVGFLLPPVLAIGFARCFQIPSEIAAGMLLLAAAPFAPVVPVFAKMARADLPLAAALTALFPFVSAFITPLVCEAGLRILLGNSSLKFSAGLVLLVLASTITLPLAAGVAVRQCCPNLGRKLLRPLEIVSEGAGAVSLAYVTAIEFHSILATGWKPLLAMALSSEILLAAGYAAGGPGAAARRVVGLGASNRNIALALLVAIESFPGSPIVAAVVANGLLLIILGLLHVAFWRFNTLHGRAEPA